MNIGLIVGFRNPGVEIAEIHKRILYIEHCSFEVLDFLCRWLYR